MSLPQRPAVGLALMLEDDFTRAAFPLIEQGEVDILEWSFDTGWDTDLPSWVYLLLDEYSKHNCLLGHGVSFSLLSACWTERQQKWLEYFQQEVNSRQYRHISEHFGFMITHNFQQSSPMPTPLTNDILTIGKQRLQKLHHIANVPIGLENLAFAFGTEDVIKQGIFLSQLLESVDGFLLLDLHNLYCQLCNFDITSDDLLKNYPLQRVKELHISGGSWSQSHYNSNKKIRRDTHDDQVPEEVFELLSYIIKNCSTIEAIIFERLGNTLHSSSSIEQYQRDFKTIKQIACH